MSTNHSTDPVRLLVDPSCPPSQRALLQHGADLAPPPGAEDLVWQALAGVIGAAAGAGSGAESANGSAAATKAAGSTTKLVGVAATLVALAAFVAAVAMLGGRLVPPKLPRPPTYVAPAPAPATPQPPATAGPSPWEPSPPPAETARVRPAHGVRRTERAPASPATRLREETTLIKEARQALRGGDNRRALRVLDECRRLFPAGVLVQERERLVIEALVRDGRTSEASVRAAEFLRRYPDSPHAGEIRGLGLGTPGGP